MGPEGRHHPGALQRVVCDASASEIEIAMLATQGPISDLHTS